jgi:hypothetical protein
MKVERDMGDDGEDRQKIAENADELRDEQPPDRAEA